MSDRVLVRIGIGLAAVTVAFSVVAGLGGGLMVGVGALVGFGLAAFAAFVALCGI